MKRRAIVSAVLLICFVTLALSLVLRDRTPEKPSDASSSSRATPGEDKGEEPAGVPSRRPIEAPSVGGASPEPDPLETSSASPPVIPEPSAVDESPAVSDSPAVGELPTVGDSPAVGDSPVVSELPTVGDSPAVGDSPVVSELPTVGESPAVDEAPPALALSPSSLVDVRVLVQGRGELSDFALTPTHVVWKERSCEPECVSRVMRMPLEGGDVERVFSEGEGLAVNNLVADEEAIYFTQEFAVYRLEYGQTTPTIIATREGKKDWKDRPHYPGQLTLDGDHVYWANRNRGFSQTPPGIWRVPRGGGNVQTLVQKYANPPLKIVIVGDDLYFARHQGTVMKLPKKGGKPRGVLQREQSMEVFATGGSSLFWYVDCCESGQTLRNALRSAPMKHAGRKTRTLLEDVVVTGIVADETHVFWIQGHYRKSQTLRRLNHAEGGEPETLVTGLENIGGVSWNDLGFQSGRLYLFAKRHIIAVTLRESATAQPR